jgi:hypothetical protein
LTSSVVSGTLPFTIDQLGIFWREKDEDSEWVSYILPMSLFSHHSIVVYTFPALAAKCYLIILFITLMEHSYGTVFPSKVIFHVDVDSNLTKL